MANGRPGDKERIVNNYFIHLYFCVNVRKALGIQKLEHFIRKQNTKSIILLNKQF